eukprot:gb/GECH01010937.1/.p1 GENE.gb/GECH01010937.1/~~gb/GECH01010937.1/.p1  ORF type:complete len:471 (+),score=49.10 gb/GECH01010937.1/:1-1413(+)
MLEINVTIESLSLKIDWIFQEVSPPKGIGPNLEDRLVQALDKHSSLRKLCLEGTLCRSSLFSKLSGRLHRLHEVALRFDIDFGSEDESHCYEAISFLESLPNIESFKHTMPSFPAEDEFLPELLPRIPSLKYLALDEYCFSDTIVHKILQHGNITRLEIHNPEGFSEFMSRLPNENNITNLTGLHLKTIGPLKSEQLAEEDIPRLLETITSSNHQLTHLSLILCFEVSRVSLPIFSREWKRLVEESLNDPLRRDSKVLTKLTKLKEFHFLEGYGFWESVPDDMIFIVRHMTELEALTLGSLVTHFDIRPLLDICCKLRLKKLHLATLLNAADVHILIDRYLSTPNAQEHLQVLVIYPNIHLESRHICRLMSQFGMMKRLRKVYFAPPFENNGYCGFHEQERSVEIVKEVKNALQHCDSLAEVVFGVSDFSENEAYDILKVYNNTNWMRWQNEGTFFDDICSMWSRSRIRK